MPRSVRLNCSVWPFPCRDTESFWFSLVQPLCRNLRWFWTQSSIPDQSVPLQEPKFHQDLAQQLSLVEAWWIQVGNAQEYFVKLLATTSTCSKPPFPFPNDRKSMANSSIGSLARIRTMGALGGCGDFLLMHLSACFVPVHIFLHSRWRGSLAD